MLAFQPAEGRISPHNKDATIAGLRRNWNAPSRFLLFGVMKSAADTVSPSEDPEVGWMCSDEINTAEILYYPSTKNSSICGTTFAFRINNAILCLKINKSNPKTNTLLCDTVT